MMMMMMMKKPGERDVGGSEMGVGLLQRFDSLPNFRSVIRTKILVFLQSQVLSTCKGTPWNTDFPMKKATNERKFPGSVLPFSPGN